MGGRSANRNYFTITSHSFFCGGRAAFLCTDRDRFSTTLHHCCEFSEYQPRTVGSWCILSSCSGLMGNACVACAEGQLECYAFQSLSTWGEDVIRRVSRV